MLMVGTTLLATSGRSQALEGIVVEQYQRVIRENDTLTTFRVFVDLAEDHTLQMVFGSEHHPLRLESTAEFFNDTINGGKYGDRIDADRLVEGSTAVDSWITINAASDAHAGVPLAQDSDGSVLRGRRYRKSPLARTDGLVPAVVKQVVDFKMQPGYLGNIRGNTILCTDCAWSVLGGTRGVTVENMVLIAQITTTGALFYELNLQIGKPGGGFVRYVAADPQGDELFHAALDNRPGRLRR